MASECRHCGKDVSAALQRCRQRYDHIDLPVIRTVVSRVEISGGAVARVDAATELMHLPPWN